MARLTKWNGKKWVLPQNKWREIAERLAAYENTGLEPEQILTIVKPQMFVIEAFSGDNYHKELWFGSPAEVAVRKEELREMCKSWNWNEPTIISTLYDKEDN